MEEFEKVKMEYKEANIDLGISVVSKLFGVFILVGVLALVLTKFGDTDAISSDNVSSEIIDKAKNGLLDFADLGQIGFLLVAVVIILGLVGVGMAYTSRMV